MEQFEFSQKMEQITSVRQELQQIGQDPLLKDNWVKMESTLKQKDADDSLRIAICGQYSAGKSTLVHALTNDNTIAIGQDVTTDKVKEYNWNGVKIADTPGIYAGRTDHDALSKEYIRKADLLIYMITIQGFTREIGSNFKSLIQGEYADKTMLLMNKRNQEPAENEQNWIRDTRDFLGDGELLKKFYFTIVDIEDYLIGQQEKEDELIAESHFNEFIEKLNKFISERQLMGKVVSRKNCLDGFLSLYIEAFSKKQEKDEFARRQKAALNTAINACNKAFRDASLRIRSGVRDLKNRLVGLLTDETIKEFKAEADNVQLQLEGMLVDQQLADDLQTAIDQLKSDMEEIETAAVQYEERLQNLAKRFQGGNIDVEGSIDLGTLKTGMKQIGLYLSKVTKDGLLKFVHILGGKFKPWGAVKWLKWLNGIGKWLGPLAALVDVAQLLMDKKHQEEMSQHRNELISTFNEIENDIVAELDKIKDSDDSLYVTLKKELQAVEKREQEQESLQIHKEELLNRLILLKNQVASI